MANEDRLLITARMFRSIFVLNKLSLPFSDHAGLVSLQKLNGLDMGYHHYERTSCAKITVFISDTMHETLIDYLIKSQTPISVIVDDTTDVSNIHYKIVYFQTIEDVSPVIYFYKLIELKAETGEAHFEAMTSAWAEEKPGFHQYMKQHLIGLASDGAATNVGKEKGMIKYLREWAKRLLFAVHCMAHRLELLADHAFGVNADMEIITNYVERTINEVYSFYGGLGHKRKTHLKQTTDKMRRKFYELKRIIEIRWISSDYNAMKTLSSMWDIIIKDLGEIEKDKNFSQTSREKARLLKIRLIGKRFLLLFNFIYDIVSELTLLSLDMQKRSALLVDASSFVKKSRGIFTNMKTENAKNVALLLHDTRCLIGNDIERCETVENYHNSDFVSYENVEWDNDVLEVPPTADYKKTILEAILKQFENYFPDGDLKNFDVLDPMNMPLPNDEASTRTWDNQNCRPE